MSRQMKDYCYYCGFFLIILLCLLFSCSERIVLIGEKKKEEIFFDSDKSDQGGFKYDEKTNDRFEQFDFISDGNIFIERQKEERIQEHITMFEGEMLKEKVIQTEILSEIKSTDGICPPQEYFATNPEHCGGCFQNCGNDKVCIDGKCQCASSWHEICDSRCVDLNFNMNINKYCSSCGRRCLLGETCWQGTCSSLCRLGLSRHCEICGNEKVNLETNFNHCGACNKKCLDSEYCLNMVCMRICITCKKDTIYCAKGCINPKDNDKHCGYCDNKCASGSYCENGQCIVLYCPICPINHELCLCSSGCINSRGDINNCGGCGRKCTPNQKCVDGQCVNNCPSTEPTLCFNEKCVNTQTDINNCGGCGLQCGAEGESCIDGTCQCPTGKIICSRGPRYESVCKCIDLQNDSKNCGKCDLWCGTEQLCINGICMNYNEAILPD